MGIDLFFCDWAKRATEQAVAFLISQNSTPTFDFRDTATIVATRQAGRHLRLGLASKAAQQGTVLFPGPIFTPQEFLSNPVHHWPPLFLSIWENLIKEINRSQFPHLFPNTVAALPAAQQIQSLREELLVGNLTIAEVIAKFPDNPEAERWLELQRLEELYLGKLQELALTDPIQAQLLFARKATIPQKRLLVLFVPDLSPLMATALTSISQSTKVAVGVYAPENYRAKFDDFGRPITALWEDEKTNLPTTSIHCHATTQEQISQAINLIAQQPPENQIRIAIGAPAAETIPLLKGELGDKAIPAYDPAGLPLSTHPTAQLITLFYNLYRHDTYAAGHALISHPHYLQYLQNANIINKPAALLNALDQFNEDHLPVSFSKTAAILDSKEHCSRTNEPVFKNLQRQLNAIRATPLALPKILAEIYSQRIIVPQKLLDQRFLKVTQLISLIFAKIEQACTQVPLTEDQIWSLILQALRSDKIYEERPVPAIAILGWLELLWEGAPCLLITGFNDQDIPETVIGHMFLPDWARTKLGLINNEMRLARDLYLFQAITASRAPGNVRVFYARTDQDGNPTKPSRLLFYCGTEELPPRVLQLFGTPSKKGIVHPHTLCWKLKIPQPSRWPNDLAVTQLRDYLACPFRFYLRQVLKMEPLNLNKMELSPQDYGNLCHETLRHFGANPDIRENDDENTIGDFLIATAEDLFRKKYGEDLSIPILLQLDSIRQRLQAWAKVQSQTRREGWHISEVEFSARCQLNDCSIHGKIDRIDMHDDGRIRVLDYKTADKVVPPPATHLQKADESTQPYQLAPGNKARWVDLQLPLYLYLLAEKTPVPAVCGYFILPKAVKETSILLWPELNKEHYNSAIRCAQEVIKLIQARHFWPPVEKNTGREFSALFLNNVHASTDSTIFTQEG